MYPISFDAAYAVERNRLTTAFRLIVAIPWLVWTYLYGIAAFVAVVIAWFVLMFTKRYPQGLYDFVAGFIRLQARVIGFAGLLTDELPSFSGKPDPDYPIQIDVARPQAEYSRAKTFFKYVLAFPQFLLGYGAQGMFAGAAFVTWWRVLFTGKQSITMHEAQRVGAAYAIRSQGFINLLTETHPRMLELPPQQVPAGAPALGPGAGPAAPSLGAAG